MSERQSKCACGKVVCKGQGSPILTGVCYCDDCQEDARRIRTDASGPAVCDEDGGTAYLTYRTDRFCCVSGEDLLKPITLKENALTTRFVTSCCNSAMYLRFGPGHWVSAYRNRFPEPLPQIEMRNRTAHRRSDLPMPTDAPQFRGYPLRLFSRLVKARIDMARGK